MNRASLYGGNNPPVPISIPHDTPFSLIWFIDGACRWKLWGAAMTRDRVKDHLGEDEQAALLVRGGDLHAALLRVAAKALGIPTDIVIGNWVEDTPPSQWLRLSLPNKVAYFRRGCLPVGAVGAALAECVHINGALCRLADSKRASKDLIRLLGFSTPDGAFFTSGQEEEATAWFRAQARPVCVKPDFGQQGTGVFPGLTTEEEFQQAFRTTAGHCPDVIVEEHAEGKAVRFFFVRPRIVGVRIDLPANVDGDGISSVARLIEAKNVEKHLRTGHTPIHVDEDVLRHLTRRNLSLDSVPARGERLFLRSVSNGSKGGDAISCMETIHPSYIRLIEEMCNAMRGFNVTAVDTKMRDPSLPATPDNYRVLEINSSPGVVPYHFPWEGEVQDVCTPLLRLLSSL
jgi:D-alanine-D-alanine ligase-like ATP-grasp enzyme